MAHCGEKLIELLEAYGIDTVFGIPGVHTIELYRGLAGSGIRHVTSRHEQGAGFMADGYARATGRPAACFIISGPGMTNIATPMGEAYAESIPMLVISSVNRTPHLAMAEGRLHELNSQRELTAGVTAFSHTLMRPDELPRLLARAFTIFNSARPRPVHIEIPLDVLDAPAEHIDARVARPPNRPRPTDDAIAEAVTLMSNAERPVLFIGGGAVDARDQIQRLVSLYDVPVAVTVNGRGLLRQKHSKLFGIYYTLPKLEQFVADADLLVAIGTDIGEPDYGPLFDRPDSMTSRFVRIDIDPEQLTRNRVADVAICADAGYALQALNDALETAPPFSLSAEWQRRLQEVQAEMRQFVDASPDMHAHERLFECIDGALDAPIVVGDNTQPVFTSNYVYEAPAPRSYFNSGTGFCTLGYALPASIGAKLGRPDRPVVCISGDGGFMFTLSELAVAVEQQLPVIAIVWNNFGYREIEKVMRDKHVDPVGVELHTPDLALLAEAFACSYFRADSPDSLTAALEQAAAFTGPTIIEVNERDFVAGS